MLYLASYCSYFLTLQSTLFKHENMMVLNMGFFRFQSQSRFKIFCELKKGNERQGIPHLP